MTLHKITEVYTELFSVYHNITSKFRTITIFKTASNKIMIQIKLIGMSMISSFPKFICLSATVHELSPQNKL
jgi:hypothetical protein